MKKVVRKKVIEEDTPVEKGYIKITEDTVLKPGCKVIFNDNLTVS